MDDLELRFWFLLIVFEIHLNVAFLLSNLLYWGATAFWGVAVAVSGVQVLRRLLQTWS